MREKSGAYRGFLQPFFLGAAAIVIQLVFFRECFFLFSANELIYAVFLTFWLIFTGAGARLANVRGRTETSNHTYSSLFVILTVAMWILLPFIRSWLIAEGEAASPAQVTMAAFIIFAPVCVLSGYLFVAFASRSEACAYVGMTYLADVAGAVFGSLVFFIAVPRITPLHVMLAFLFLFILSQLWFSKRNILLYIVVLWLTGAWPLAEIFQQKGLLRGQHIAEVCEGSDGKYLITRNGEQTNLYSGSEFIYSSDYNLHNEEMVHVAMLQHGNPKHVLVVNAYSPGVTEEMKKYKEVQVTYIENDYRKTELMNRYFGGEVQDGRIIRHTDVITFSGISEAKYDVVIVQAGGTASLHDNRHFTRYFFRNMSRLLNDDGYLLMNWNGASEYFGGGFGDILSVIRNNAASEFSAVRMIPLSTVYLLASRKGQIEPRIGTLSEARGLESDFINPFFIDDNLLETRVAGLEKKLGPVNISEAGNQPQVFITGLKQWLQQYRPLYFFIPLFLLLLFVLISAFRNIPVGLVMHGAGFITASLTSLLLLIFVYVSGTMQTGMAVFFCSAMAGTGAGTLLNMRIRRGNKNIVFPLFIMIVILLFIIFSHDLIFSVSVMTAKWAVLLLVFLAGGCSGFIFFALSLQAVGNSSKKAALLFSEDVWGGFSGGLLSSLVLIPYLGFAGTAMVVLLISLAVTGLSLRYKYF